MSEINMIVRVKKKEIFNNTVAFHQRFEWAAVFVTPRRLDAMLY